MITERVRALKDTSLNTGVATYNLVRGEVFIGEFKDHTVLDALIQIGVLEKTSDDVEKLIPVILPPEITSVQQWWNTSQEITTILLDESGEVIPLSST